MINSYKREMPIIGEPFIEIPVTDSTNIYAMQEVHALLANHGKTYFAHHQTAGKGQRGRSWHSRPGENIQMSVVLDPKPVPISRAFSLSAAIALGCYDFFNSFAGDGTRIKWPNDIYWRDRKAGGILIENIIQGSNWTHAVAGIGLNINSSAFDPSLPNPVSLRQITGKEFDVIQLAGELCRYLQRRWEEWRATPDKLLSSYNEVLYRKGLISRFRKGSRVFEGRVDGVNGHGQLEVFTGITEYFDHGAVDWLPG